MTTTAPAADVTFGAASATVTTPLGSVTFEINRNLRDGDVYANIADATLKVGRRTVNVDGNHVTPGVTNAHGKMVDDQTLVDTVYAALADAWTLLTTVHADHTNRIADKVAKSDATQRLAAADARVRSRAAEVADSLQCLDEAVQWQVRLSLIARGVHPAQIVDEPVNRDTLMALVGPIN